MTDVYPALVVAVFVGVLRSSAKPWAIARVDMSKRMNNAALYVLSHVHDTVIQCFCEGN